MTEITDFEVQEDAQRRRYFKTMPDGEEAELTLVKTSPTQWIATHTFVPPAHRGSDIAAKLVERLVTDARSEGAKIRATCWYVADAFKRRAAEWEDVRA